MGLNIAIHAENNERRQIICTHETFSCANIRFSWHTRVAIVQSSKKFRKNALHSETMKPHVAIACVPWKKVRAISQLLSHLVTGLE